MFRPLTRRGLQRVAGYMLCVVLLAGLYLGNLGLLCGMLARGWISDKNYELALNTVYFPLVWIDQNTPFFETHPIGKAYDDWLESFAE